MAFITNQELCNNNANSNSSYLTTNRITFYLNEPHIRIGFYLPERKLTNLQSPYYDIDVTDEYTDLKLKDNLLTFVSYKDIVYQAKKKIIEFLEFYNTIDNLNTSFNLVYSHYGNIDTYSGSGHQLLKELIKNI